MKSLRLHFIQRDQCMDQKKSSVFDVTSLRENAGKIKCKYAHTV